MDTTIPTASKIHLGPTHRGVFHVPKVNSEAAIKASELLQENHETHHIFFNNQLLHNHIVHHILTIYALGASPSVLQHAYDLNKTYQRPMVPLNETVVHDLQDPSRFKKSLGEEVNYQNYLRLFQSEIDQKGWQLVLNEYLFKGDEAADDLLIRSFAGFFHPIIHLGFGVEFEQPAIIAEALAQTAVHDTWPSLLLQGAERAAGDRNGKPGSKSLVQLLDEVRADPKLSTSAHWSDGHKIRNGIYERAPKQMIQYASQWTVGPEQLEEKTAEMLNAAVYSAGGAQHPPKQVKFDFLLIHDVNCSIFFSAFLKQAWLSPQVKARLLEWKGRMDLAMYVSRGSPKLLLEEIKNYQPKEKPNLAGDSWGGIFGRASAFEDDGHTSKLVRTLAHGEEICRPFESLGSFRVKGDMWLKLGNMAIDSVEDCGDQWVRSAGFDEAWEKFEDRPRAQL